MPSSGQQAALSLIAVIAVPALVGQAVAPSEAPPALKKASLTVQLEGSEQGSSSSGRILINALGNPPANTNLLNSVDGLKTVTVRPGTACSGLPAHRAAQTPGGQPWCFSLEGISAGSSVSGQLSGAETELTLTVNRRADFWWGAFLLIIAGLVAGGLAILVPKFLRRSARGALLATLLDENDSAAPAKRIDDLRAWVTKQRDHKKTDDEILPAATDLVQRGPGIAERARAELGRIVGLASLPADHPAMVAATLELSRPGHACADFLDDEGKPVTHPAALQAQVLGELETQARKLRELQNAIQALPENLRSEPGKALRAAEARFDIAATQDDIVELHALIDDTRQAIASAKRGSAEFADVGTLTILGGGPVAAASSPPELVTGTIAAQEGPGAWDWVRRFALPIALTALVLLAVVAWAVLTLKLTVYDAKPAFGSTADYLALLVAAVGSGAAGTILGTVSVWNPLSAAEEA